MAEHYTPKRNQTGNEQVPAGPADSLVPVFIPALAPLLLRAEQLKGTPLTETEVIRIRDGAVCMMMAPERAREMDESRGYRDIDPEKCWAEWQQMRVELGKPEGTEPG